MQNPLTNIVIKWIEPDSTVIDFGCGNGSLLTELGVPTPNLFTGMQNIHGPLEWISAQDMQKATHLCLEIIKEVSKEKE